MAAPRIYHFGAFFPTLYKHHRQSENARFAGRFAISISICMLRRFYLLLFYVLSLPLASNEKSDHIDLVVCGR